MLAAHGKFTRCDKSLDVSPHKVRNTTDSDVMISPETDVRTADAGFDAAILEEGTSAFDGLPGRFCMFFQPDARLADGTVGGSEGLLRWWHPDFGMLRPDLSLRGTRWDDTTRIEDWAASTVCEQAAAWTALDADVTVALNVSRRYLLADGFADTIDRVIDESGIEPGRLAIDLPVAALATNRSQVRAVASALTARGVTVVLDGVGVRTRRLRIDEIEADVWKVDLWSSAPAWSHLHPAVVHALEEAERLGITTIAKSVEDEATLALVRDAGFDRAFGHLISPAVTSAAMTTLLRRRTHLLD